MKTTETALPDITIHVSHYDREALLAARHRIDQALQRLVVDKKLIASLDALTAFAAKNQTYRYVRIDEAQHELYISVLRLWNMSGTRARFNARLQEQKRTSQDGFLLDELIIEGFPFRIIGNNKATRVQMLWDYLGHFGIFRPDRRIQNRKPKAS